MKLFTALYVQGLVSGQFGQFQPIRVGGASRPIRGRTNEDSIFLNPRALGFSNDEFNFLNLDDSARGRKNGGSKAAQKKLEREKERKKRIAEKLANGKDVGNNKREKGKTVFIDEYTGPDGELVLETPEMQADYSPPKKPIKTTADPYTTEETTKKPNKTKKPKTTTEDSYAMTTTESTTTTKKTTKKPKPTKTTTTTTTYTTTTTEKKTKKPKPSKTTTTTTTTTTEEYTTPTTTTTTKKTTKKPKPSKTTTTTTEYTTTTEKKTKKPKPTDPYTSTGGDSSGAADDEDFDNVYAPDSEVKGDPHFMVKSPGQDPVCFDADAPPGEEVALIFDPVTGLSISGVIEHREQLNRTVIDTMYILTPGGVKIHMSDEGLIVDGYRNPFKKLHPKMNTENGRLLVGDVEVQQLVRGAGLRAIRFTIENGPVFHVQEKLLTRAMGLVWENELGLSEKTRGVLGQFMKHSIYHITYHQHTLNKGTLHFHGTSIPVEKLHHEHHDCWTISQKDTIRFLNGPLSSFGSK